MSAPATRGAARGSRKGLRAALPALGLLALLAADLLSTVAAQAEQPVNLSRTTGPSGEPAVAVSGGDALVAWTEGEQIWYARRTAGAWLPAAPIPGAAGSAPAVAAGPDGTFHVAWSGFSLVDDNEEVYHCALRQGSWSLPENISGTSSDSIGPAIAARADGALLVVWTEQATDGPRIVAASRTSAAGWSSGPLPDAEGTDPVVAAAGADWHVAWSQVVEPEQPSEIVYMRRSASGWSLPEVVSASPSVASSDAGLALDGSGMPAIAWLEADGGIGFSRRSASGWTDPQTLAAATPGALGRPALAASGDRFAAAWASQADIQARFDVAGAPTAARPVLSFARRASGAAIAADGDGFLVAAEGREATDAGDVYAVRVRAEAAATPTATGAPSATSTHPPSTAEPTGTLPPATATATTAATATGAAPSASPAATTAVPTPAPAATTPAAGGADRTFLPSVLRSVRLSR